MVRTCDDGRDQCPETSVSGSGHTGCGQQDVWLMSVGPYPQGPLMVCGPVPDTVRHMMWELVPARLSPCPDGRLEGFQNFSFASQLTQCLVFLLM